jgi:hypothetical protein
MPPISSKSHAKKSLLTLIFLTLSLIIELASTLNHITSLFHPHLMYW